MSARTIRYNLELLLARTASVLLPRLPRRCVVAIANVVGSAAATLARNERAVARANLDIAFGETKTPAEKNRIIRRSFQTVALTALDLFWFSRNTVERLKRHVTFAPNSEEQLCGGGARICITAHYGNWEVLGMAISARGHRLTSVAAPLANRRLDKLFLEVRTRTGQRILYKHGAIRGLLSAIKSGEIIALVLDQNTRPSAGGVFVNFFGLPAPISPAPAALALRTGAPVLIGVCYPDLTGHYHVPPPIHVDCSPQPGSSTPERELTQTITRHLEDLLRQRPEHWLWMYKRWKYFPPGSDHTRFPAYAKEMNRKDREAAA